MNSGANKILCFGEALWDIFGDKRHVGGAPLNVAYHLNRLGSLAWPVSAVGDDELGAALLEQLSNWQIPSDLVVTHPRKATGTVIVDDSNGSPRYTITEDVAWDYVTLPDGRLDKCQPVHAIVFGTLAQRTPRNVDVLQGTLGACEGAIRIFDVNLRPPFTPLPLVWDLASHADILKVNHEEAILLLKTSGQTDSYEAQARSISRNSGCSTICLTAGAEGAGLLENDEWYWLDCSPVKVRDTVGAGDAFLAALIHSLLSDPDNPLEALNAASKLAAFVASSHGATPEYVGEPWG